MLQALLHRKLNELEPEPQRKEDALTSTVFGMLVYVEAWKTLAEWLGEYPLAPSTGHKDSFRGYWFWPRLESAGRVVEPDVLLRVGETLLVVEAKYRSGRHDVVVHDETDKSEGDQILRQYNAITVSRASRRSYSEEIEHALKKCCLVQVLVVDERRIRRARREYQESRKHLPAEATFRLVTWQNLDRLLQKPNFSKQNWARELRCYLQLSGLDTFDGIGRSFPTSRTVALLWKWQARSVSLRARGNWPEFPDRRLLAELGRWTSGSDSSVTRGLFETVYSDIVDGNRLLSWRISSETERSGIDDFQSIKEDGTDE